MKKTIFTVLLMVSTVLSVVGSRTDEITLVLVPREDGVVRVGMDIANRYPTLLVSYKIGLNGAVSLHGWTGKEWVNIDQKNYLIGDFFRTGPDSALIIEGNGVLFPESLIPPTEWCNAVYKIGTTELRPLIHLVGQYYDFKYKDWDWFSENYRMPIDGINPEGLNVSWYHKRLQDNLKTSPVVGNDLKYWMAIRHPEPVIPVELPADDVMSEEQIGADTNAVDSVQEPELEMTEELTENPFTNDAPAAVVMAAGNAEEAKTNLIERVEQE